MSEANSVQKLDKSSAGLIVTDHVLAFALNVGATLTKAPRYWSRSRDDWMARFVHKEGNDLLAGAISTMAAKVAATPWYVEGPLVLAEMVRKQLLNWSDFNQGWNSFVTKWVTSYLNRDFGGVVENLRASRSDKEGPALGYAHLDESKCLPTGDPEYPIAYNQGERWVKMHHSWVSHIVDMPSPDDDLRGVGFCSVSRTLSTASILLDLVRYKREKLSDLPPAGLLMINNLSPEEWDDIITKYDARQKNQGNTTWRDLMTVFGYDPAYPLSAELLSFSELWENFSEEESTRLAIYSFALGFRTDPREFWPVSAGPLGTATEAEVQARKAVGKGTGIIYAAIEEKLNGPNALPEGVTFHFDFQDDEQDMRDAEIKNRHAQWIRRLWEGRNPGTSNVAQGGVSSVDTPELAPQVGGIITTEQAQALLVRHRIVPADILGLTMDTGRLYNQRAYGPQVRVHRSGAVTRRL